MEIWEILSPPSIIKEEKQERDGQKVRKSEEGKGQIKTLLVMWKFLSAPYKLGN